MKKGLIKEIECLSYSNIDTFIQFWGVRENIEKADIEPMQADILFYLNSLKHFWLKADSMQKFLKRIDNIAESCGAEAHIVRKMVQEALKGVANE